MFNFKKLTQFLGLDQYRASGSRHLHDKTHGDHFGLFPSSFSIEAVDLSAQIEPSQMGRSSLPGQLVPGFRHLCCDPSRVGPTTRVFGGAVTCRHRPVLAAVCYSEEMN